MSVGPSPWLGSGLVARTRYFDEEVLSAISREMTQIVSIGAGYDDRALRFRSAGVRFFEVDHPFTQCDKSKRLASIGADVRNLQLVEADFRRDEVERVLRDAGHDSKLPSLFNCEGVIVYLEETVARRLLAGLKLCAAPESTLAVSLAVHRDWVDSRVAVSVANAARRTARTEPWRTILPLDEHVALVSDAGWRVDRIVDASQLDAGAEPGRSVFVSARPST